MKFNFTIIFLSLGTAPLLFPQSSELQELIVNSLTAPSSLTVPDEVAAREDIRGVPGGAEVVGAERFLTGRSSTMADTFALSPGVIAQPRFGSDEARLSIRGSGIQRTFHGRGIRVMQDGVPINLADGGFDMQAIDALAASHIRIWRGGNALAAGGSTLGGAIDYVSHTGRSAPGGSLRIEGGSFDYLRARVAYGMANDSHDAYLSLSQAYQDGFRDHARQNTQRLFANVGWRVADHVETRWFFTSVLTDSELPGNLTKAELRENPRQTAPANVANDQKRDFDLHRIASRTTVVNGANTWDFLAVWTHKDLDHPIFQVIDQNSNDLVLGVTLRYDGELFGRDHGIRAGAHYSRGETKAANFANVGGNRGALLQQNEQTAENLEAFFESRLDLGAGFTSVLGVSASDNRRKNDRIFGPTPPNSSYDRSFTDVSPKVGLLYETGSTQIYANVSGSHEPPSFSEAGTAVVATRAQSATTVEIGTRGSHRALRWDVSAYHGRVRNELLTVQLPPPAFIGQTGTINASRTIHEGIEWFTEFDFIGAGWDDDPDQRLVGRAAWTYGRFRFDGDPVYGNNTLAGLPPHLIRGEMMWEHRDGWYVGPTFEWVPEKTWIDHRNTFAADSHALLGFRFGRRQPEGLSWFVEARNLTDKVYAATTGAVENAGGAEQRQFLPGDGRSFFAGIEWRW
ncbi:MAG: TonB-dependent receptor family protein [Luteolibacter sp.]